MEIDPHYFKLKKRGMYFLETVEKNFLGFNDPSKHQHVKKFRIFEIILIGST